MKHLPLLLALPSLFWAGDLLINAVALGLAGLLTLTLCGLLLAPLRHRLDAPQMTLAALMLACLCLGSAQLLLQILSHDLAATLEPALALLLLPALALPRTSTLLAGLGAGLRLAALALLFGSLRELFGHGSLLTHADWLPGLALNGWQFLHGLPLLTHAAGAFILAGLLLALQRYRKPENV
ncbi:Rnf-Nqr domain containing protein [Pseudomonas sp. NCCP-436]|uniref:Rnf-Nqr domain containing protein n=1 Tax=Pseudomonas sp. NCCP-436 TaxID=2842481 RepID=UPI001C7E1F6D|nr:Rnf-Nqr domain containing protein [Pseudomonas sp. NCCP-436]GIZ11032.1 hypothetical protein NCCP436_04480 [Pseudomonas sp. NCCP-436]